jgi:hypothetical protein
LFSKRGGILSIVNAASNSVLTFEFSSSPKLFFSIFWAEINKSKSLIHFFLSMISSPKLLSKLSQWSARWIWLRLLYEQTLNDVLSVIQSCFSSEFDFEKKYKLNLIFTINFCEH